ncbi:MAG: sensor histidine kinase, partial [Gammaproteobacteria bacterium]
MFRRDTVLTERRLALLLVAFFLALALPALILVKQAFDQLQWEVFHRYRVQAEDLVGRLDGELSAVLAAEDARPFDAYRFAGGRSPLAALRPDSGLPGVVGYFQVDAAGRFSTPLLPETVGELPAAEQHERRALGERMRQAL